MFLFDQVRMPLLIQVLKTRMGLVVVPLIAAAAAVAAGWKASDPESVAISVDSLSCVLSLLPPLTACQTQKTPGGLLRIPRVAPPYQSLPLLTPPCMQYFPLGPVVFPLPVATLPI